MSVKICRILTYVFKKDKSLLRLLRNSSNFYIFTSYELDSISGSSLLALGFRGWKGITCLRVHEGQHNTNRDEGDTKNGTTAMTAFDSSVFLPSVEISKISGS